jgi:hypothetical protein
MKFSIQYSKQVNRDATGHGEKLTVCYQIYKAKDLRVITTQHPYDLHKIRQQAEDLPSS